MARSLVTPLAGAAAIAALALAGCGSVTAAESASTSAAGTSPAATSSAGPAAPVTASHLLCARPAAVSRVVIARTGVLPRVPEPVGAGASSTAPSRDNMPKPPAQPERPPAARTVVTSAVKARALARSLCALPPFPHEPVNCPALIAGYYRLTFTADGRQLPAVTVQDTGCQTVTGLGIVRSAATRTAFWKILTSLAGQPIPLPVHLPVNPGGPMRPMT